MSMQLSQRVGWFGLVLIVFLAMPVSFNGVMSLQYNQAVAEENNMAKIQLILKKLRSSMGSMKDFDDLEKAGMSKRNVDRLRRAMSQKIQQLTDEAVNSIHDL